MVRTIRSPVARRDLDLDLKELAIPVLVSTDCLIRGLLAMGELESAVVVKCENSILDFSLAPVPQAARSTFLLWLQYYLTDITLVSLPDLSL